MRTLCEIVTQYLTKYVDSLMLSRCLVLTAIFIIVIIRFTSSTVNPHESCLAPSFLQNTIEIF